MVNMRNADYEILKENASKWSKTYQGWEWNGFKFLLDYNKDRGNTLISCCVPLQGKDGKARFFNVQLEYPADIQNVVKDGKSNGEFLPNGTTLIAMENRLKVMAIKALAEGMLQIEVELIIKNIPKS